MDIVALLPFIVLIGAMFLMTRSAKNKQRAAVQMRDRMQPGTGVRTIGGLYATVKEVNDDTVIVEIAPGVHATFAKNAIGAVLEDEEYDRIVNGGIAGSLKTGDSTVVPDSPADLDRVDLGKHAEDPGAAPEGPADEPADDKAAEGKAGEDAPAEASDEASDEAKRDDEDGPAAK